MKLSQFAEEYCLKHNLRRTPIHGANRFTRITGVSDPNEIDDATIESFRKDTASTLSAWTIKKTITDVIQLIRMSTGRELNPGRRLRKPRPTPKAALLDHITSMWDHSPVWLRQWIGIAYWTGLRLSDAIALQCSLHDAQITEPLQWTASKTGHTHSWPVPKWLGRILQPTTLPYCRANCNATKCVRENMQIACISAKIAVINPKQLRQTSITEWSRASGSAVGIIHGCSLGVLKHYVDQLSVLETVAPRVRLPSCFEGEDDPAEELTSLILRLDPDAQRIISDTARRLATG